MPARDRLLDDSWSVGTSTIGSISLGIALVAGRKRVPRPAAGDHRLADTRHATVGIVQRTRARPLRARLQLGGTVAPAGRCASARGQLVVGAHGDAEPARHVGDALRAQALGAGGGHPHAAVDEPQRHRQPRR